ncbi:phospholipase A1-Igamma1, chloroplastic-like [Lotus japonicus]|uniref:phospholipase A1-Igamma1, chloroplastic-like n=1 Tax=Lotus japonicus TaxID=34305 RepID=UPI00258B4DC1|nr:phospholipase A1-Igamma1, chloroplastic-like [Lotus japonicus]
MAASSSISHMLIPSPKTHQPISFRSKLNPTPPPSLPQNQKSTKLIVHSKSSLSMSPTTTTSELHREQQHQQEPAVVMHQTTYHKSEEQQQLSDVWREIHGENEWAGLLDPMDKTLRQELIRYGEMAQACYDAFDFDPFSKYCGSCRFTRGNFFNSLGMSDHGYTVTRYLYATANIDLPKFFKQSRWPKMWSKHANWAGYVAVSDDATSRRLGRRDITVAWRGTVTYLEWVVDLMDFLIPISSQSIPCPDQTVKVESGFLELYTDKEQDCSYSKYSAREQVLSEVKRLMEIYHDEELSITITGHSLGSALAILSAYDIAETGLNMKRDNSIVPVSVMSFSGPRVGNARFKERLEMLGVKVLRVVNVHDLVPKTPGFLFNEHRPLAVMKIAEALPWSYSHVGEELVLDHKNSPFLKPDADAVCAHNLEVLLHLIDGYHGKGQRFILSTGRDPALVNKACDCLKDHYLVPPHWRQDENKGMIRGNDGRWVQPERPKLDDHPEDMLHHLRQLGLTSSDI